MNTLVREIELPPTEEETKPTRPAALVRAVRNWSVRIGGVSLALLALLSICAPWITGLRKAMPRSAIRLSIDSPVVTGS